MKTPTRPESIDPALWAMCLEVDTACVSDVLNARGIANKALRPGIRSVTGDARVVGIARTMRSRPREMPPDPGREYGLLFEAIDGLQPGGVLVTDEMGCCVWGELCCERALVRGANVTVIDGYHRDTVRVAASGLPVFSRGGHPSDMLYHRDIVAIDQPVHCGGVFVTPGNMSEHYPDDLGMSNPDHRAPEYDALDDYPAFCVAAAQRTVADPGSLGIVLGGSGNGEQIAANKVPGARCALAWSVETAQLARQHNNAQLIGIGGRMHSKEEALAIVDAFLATAWSEEPRHQRRIDILADYERTGEAPALPDAQ